MTIAEVLRKVDMIKPNRFTKEQKVAWLEDIERQIWFDIVMTHDNPMMIQQRHYDVNSDPDTVLIAPPPYDELYTLYLQCQIDLGNMEIGKYNNNRTLFNNSLMTFRDYWNRTFMPCNRAKCFIYDDRKRGPHFPYNGRQLHSMGNPLNMHEHYGPKPYHDGGIATHGPMPHCGEMTPGVAITPVKPAPKPCHGPMIPGMKFMGKAGLPPMSMPHSQNVVEEIVQIHATDKQQGMKIKKLKNELAAVQETDKNQESAINSIKNDIAIVRETDKVHEDDINQLKNDLAENTLTEMTEADIGSIIND